ncbi:MAG TPA: PhoH family protein [Bacteroidales bacterium]|nr:PhoH family protein [Bacteroidales bacterium]
MSEKVITLDLFDPVEFLGVNDANLNFFKTYFPSLKIIARDESIKVIGSNSDIKTFELKLNILLKYFYKHGKISEDIISKIIEVNEEDIDKMNIENNNVLVYGRNGHVIKARTSNQQKLVDSCMKNDMVFAIGPAGTGKTYTAVALAVRALKNREVKRIILTRPAVEAGESLGFLPGDLRDKIDPYLQPLYDALSEMIPLQKLASYMEDGIIEVAPLAFMRGRTLDNSFAILDEAQNTSILQMKMFLTRMGKSSKFIITGDITQIDLPNSQTSGLLNAMKILQNVSGIDFIYLNNSDILRHKLVSQILECYSKHNKE